MLVCWRKDVGAMRSQRIMPYEPRKERKCAGTPEGMRAPAQESCGGAVCLDGDGGVEIGGVWDGGRL